MPTKRLSDLLRDVDGRRFGTDDVEISSLAYDSRLVQPGALFFALPGTHTDGSAYVADAAARGAAALVTQVELNNPPLPGIVVGDARSAMSALSAAFFDRPADELFVVGVTGTDGKSTTVYFLWQLLLLLGVPTGFLSTPAVGILDSVEKNPFRQSTPEAPEIHRFLRDMATAGCRVAVVEATSHGLSRKTGRLRDVDFDAGVFTNISHEHLEFHGSFEQYRSDKGNLFRSLARPDRKASARNNRFAVVNADDPESVYMAGLARCDVLRYASSNSGPELHNVDLRYTVLHRAEGLGFTLEAEPGVEHGPRSAHGGLPFLGDFHVSNLAAALLAAAGITGHHPFDFVSLCSQLKTLPGRMTRIGPDNPFVSVVDYAHTPGSFSVVLPQLRRLVRDSGRLIVLFGSAGERDREKRRMQGEVAGRFADQVILTDEDPRGEDSEAILREIALGAAVGLPPGAVHRVADRRRAVELAVELAKPGDVLAFLGKGHESSIIYRDRVLAWDEVTVVREVLAEKGYSDVVG